MQYSCAQVTFSPIRGATAAPQPISLINGRLGGNGCNRLTGWMQLHRHNCIPLPHSKLFGMLKNRKVFCFCLFATILAQNKHFVHVHSHNQSVTSDKRKVLFYATLLAPNGKKTFPFFNTLKSFEWGSEMQLCLCHCIHPVSPLQPFRPVAHYGRSGPWCCSGVAYGRGSILCATVRVFNVGQIFSHLDCQQFCGQSHPEAG